MFMKETPHMKVMLYSELILANQYIDKHIKSVHEVTERTDSALKFKKYDKKFSSNRYLKVHMKLNHEEKKPFECPKAHEVKKLVQFVRPHLQRKVTEQSISLTCMERKIDLIV